MKLHISIDVPDEWLTPSRVHELVAAGHQMRVGIGPADTFGVHNTVYLSAMLTETEVLTPDRRGLAHNTGGDGLMVTTMTPAAIVYAQAIPDDGRPMDAPAVAR